MRIEFNKFQRIYTKEVLNFVRATMIEEFNEEHREEIEEEFNLNNVVLYVLSMDEFRATVRIMTEENLIISPNLLVDYKVEFEKEFIKGMNRNVSCFKCGEECSTQQYKVRFVDEEGDIKYKDCCSIECCQEIVKYYGYLHNARYETTINQEFQRLR